MQATVPTPATAAQLAASITFLLSDDGTSVNGSIFASDGGKSRRRPIAALVHLVGQEVLGRFGYQRGELLWCRGPDTRVMRQRSTGSYPLSGPTGITQDGLSWS